MSEEEEAEFERHAEILKQIDSTITLNNWEWSGIVAAAQLIAAMAPDGEEKQGLLLSIEHMTGVIKMETDLWRAAQAEKGEDE